MRSSQTLCATPPWDGNGQHVPRCILAFFRRRGRPLPSSPSGDTPCLSRITAIDEMRCRPLPSLLNAAPGSSCARRAAEKRSSPFAPNETVVARARVTSRGEDRWSSGCDPDLGVIAILSLSRVKQASRSSREISEVLCDHHARKQRIGFARRDVDRVELVGLTTWCLAASGNTHACRSRRTERGSCHPALPGPNHVALPRESPARGATVVNPRG